MQPDQERVFDILQQHVALSHYVFLLIWAKESDLVGEA